MPEHGTHAETYGGIHDSAKNMISTRGGVDKVPTDPCRECSEIVYFQTDGDGGLLAVDPKTWTPHRHQGDV